ncbi:MAG: hypothetical protein ACRDE2_08110, partial [Chitinophagaceae bacterium]
MVTSKYYIFFFLSLICSYYPTRAQNNLSVTEKMYVRLLKGFIDHVKLNNEERDGNFTETYVPNDSAQNKRMDSLIQIRQTKDTVEIKYMLTHYFVPGNDSLAAHEHWDKDSLLNSLCHAFYPQYTEFSNFIQSLGRETLSNLKIEPLRFYKNKFYYNHFEPYQRENSLVFFDKRQPDKLLGVVLCVP